MSTMNLDRAVEPVVLDVGDKRFYTTIGSLTDRSGYFESLFSGRWPIPRREDGSIFVDADPKVFSRIVSYLRHGIFPLCYNPETGHDYSLYQEILAEAKYYQLPELELWLTDHCYCKADQVAVKKRRRNHSKDMIAAAIWQRLPHRTIMRVS
ncbi:BTB/POZ protein [Coniochaeta sp. 2T2.1]|nr:BTB/POZ protein [Coniochaeta sp. 2T2.1]